MKIKRRMWGGAVAVLAGGAVALTGVASGTSSAPDQSVLRKAKTKDQLMAGRKAMPDGPMTVMTFWRNGKFHKVYIATHRSESADGTTSIAEIGDPTTPAQIEAQLPPVDHAMDGVQPTPAEADSAKADVASEQRALKAQFDKAEGVTRMPAGAESSAPGPAAPTP